MRLDKIWVPMYIANISPYQEHGRQDCKTWYAIHADRELDVGKNNIY